LDGGKLSVRCDQQQLVRGSSYSTVQHVQYFVALGWKWPMLSAQWLGRWIAIAVGIRDIELDLDAAGTSK
jgi:hypothetical protein